MERATGSAPRFFCICYNTLFYYADVELSANKKCYNMKQTIHKFLLLTLLAMVGVINAAAASYYLDGIYYRLDRHTKTAEVTYNNCNDYSGVVVVPEKITYESVDYTVTGIGSSAFSRCEDLTSVTIPNSVTSIGENAFYRCTALQSVPIPNSVTSIGKYAFALCKGLKSMAIPNSVTSIEEQTFYYCSGLESITIPNSITRVGDYAFQYCENLKEVHISDLKAWCNITYDTNRSTNPLYYAKHLYLNGNEVKNLVIPDGITSINGHIFEGCVSFESVTIPKSVTSIGEYAFKNCSSLKSVTIPNTVTSIGEFAFYCCI